ncbi:MAG: hypothetical protein ACR2PK_00675 [Acidimicrobiales bacterium]
MNQEDRESEDRGLPLQRVVTDTSDRRVALIWLSVFVASLIVLSATSAVDDRPTWLVLVLAVLALAALVGAWRATWVWVGWSNPQLLLPSSEPLHLGDVVHARFRRRVRRRPDSGIEVSAELQVQERVKTSAGVGSTMAEIVYSAPVEVASNDVDNLGEDCDLILDIPLSAAPPTMDLGNNEVRWELVIDTSSPAAPTDRSTFALEVGPMVARRLQDGGSGR